MNCRIWILYSTTRKRHLIIQCQCVQASSSVYHYRNIAKLYELEKWFSDLLSKFFFPLKFDFSAETWSFLPQLPHPRHKYITSIRHCPVPTIQIPATLSITTLLCWFLPLSNTHTSNTYIPNFLHLQVSLLIEFLPSFFPAHLLN